MLMLCNFDVREFSIYFISYQVHTESLCIITFLEWRSNKFTKEIKHTFLSFNSSGIIYVDNVIKEIVSSCTVCALQDNYSNIYR